MNMRFWCARCGRSYDVPRRLAGRRVRCRACGHVQAIPEPVGPAPVEAVRAPSTYALAREGPAAPAPAPPRPPAPESHPRPRRLRTPSWREHLGEVTGEAGRLQGLSLVLLALSATDLFVTFALLRTSPRFYESNPVALWVFSRWNMAGMTFFKFGAVAVAIALGEVIERRRPGWGKAVLLVGCVATAAVVWHGLRLYMGHGLGSIAGGE